MTIAVTLPVRVRVDPRTAADPATVVEAFAAGFERALDTSLQLAVRPRGARPALASEPSFVWSGEALSEVSLGVRSRLESAVTHAIFARVAVWKDATTFSESSADVAPQPALPSQPAVLETPALLTTHAAPNEVLPVFELPPETRVSASWTRWLEIASVWDSLVAAPSDPGEAFDVQARAFADRLESAIDFVPDVRRIVETGFARHTGVELPALDLMCAQLDRGFVLAFAEALQQRHFVDFTVDRAIVPLVVIAYRALLGEDQHTNPERTQSVVGALRRAFPPTRLDQVAGAPIAISFDRIVATRLPIADFRDALVAGGFDQAAAAAFTVSFVHSLLEALVDEYRQLMDAVVERLAAIQRIFVVNADAAPMPGVQVRRLTAEFDELVASIAGRTPRAAVESGREAAAVQKRLEKALLFVVSAASQWRADFRPSPAGGFYLVLVPPPLDITDTQYYGSESGRDQLRDLLKSYAALCDQWRPHGARGLIWQTGIKWLDDLLGGIVGQLKADPSLFFAEPRGDA